MKKEVKIAHLADVHVRPHKYMDEMQYTFDRFLESIRNENVDLAVIAGDFFHSKVTVSNEYFQVAFKFFKDLSEICETIIIPGNHDSVLSNQGRLDAITPIVEAVNALGQKRIIYMLNSESLSLKEEVLKDAPASIPDVSFHHFSIHDNKDKWPLRDNLNHKEVNIALYHGCIESCTLDNGWVSRGNRDDISIFDGFDYAFLGDIHRRQFLNADKTVAYPGSLRQNNFAEDIDKGYLLWTIRGKDDFDVQEVILEQKRYFFTFFLDSIKDLADIGELPQDCRIRVKALKAFDVAEEIEIKKEIIEKYKPSSEILIVPPDEAVENSSVKVGNLDIIHDNIRDPEIQKELISEYLERKKVDKDLIEKVIALDKIYHSSVETDVLRNIIYEIKNLKFDNFFTYGRDNKIDFTKLKGMIGVFGPNGSGKSSIFDVIAFAMHNSIYKTGANKNGEYINRKCKKAEVKLEIEFNKKDFVIEREIKKLFSESKPEPKIENSVDFYTKPKTKESRLNGETIPETNKFIRDIFGEKEDLETTSYIHQFGLTSFIDARGTKRKESLSKFFDLGVFETKYDLALEDHKEVKVKIKNCNKTTLLKESAEAENLVLAEQDRKEENLAKMEALAIESEQIQSKIYELMESKIPVDKNIEKFDEEKIRKLNEKLDQIKNLDEDHAKVLAEKLDKLKIKQTDHVKAKFQLNILKTNSDLIGKIPDQEVCKTCSLASGAYKSRDEMVKVSKEIESINFNQSEFDQTTLTLKEIQEQIKLKKKLSEDLSSVEKYLQNKSAIEKNEEIQIKISDLRSKKTELESKIKKMRDENSLIEQKIGFALAKVEEIESKLSIEQELLERDKLYSLYLDCMSKNGISYWIISKKLILVNKLVNQIISHAVSYKFIIEDNEEEKSIKMFIIKDGSKIPIELTSGGEKTIISIALRAALWRICLLPKTPILILDESLSFLDGEKYDSTIKLLKYLSQNFFDKIFIITHNEELKKLMDDTIYVNVKKNGFVSCEVK